MSGPISELFGASAGGFYEQKLILTSSTFTCPSDGLYLLTAIGGGAAGTNSGRGGCAGGFANRLWRLTRGAVANITIGAGGATNGASGGNTFIVFPDLYMQADGGSSTAGGGAFGGEINITGGASGNTAGSGGGAVGIYGVGYASTATGGGGGAGTGGQNAGVDGGTALLNRNGSSGYAGGRILLPVGRGGNQTYPDGEAGGGGRGGIGVNGGNGGIFAGGGGAGTGFNGGSGGLGGGGGGSLNAAGGAGGNGCVIIEFYRS